MCANPIALAVLLLPPAAAYCVCVLLLLPLCRRAGRRYLIARRSTTNTQPHTCVAVTKCMALS
jgi:hypothetical protein